MDPLIAGVLCTSTSHAPKGDFSDLVPPNLLWEC